MEDFSPWPETRPAQAAACRRTRVRPAGRGAGVLWLVFLGAALGSGAGVRSIAPGRFRPGEGVGRRRGAGRACAGGLVPVFEHAVRGRVSGREHGMRVRRADHGVRADRPDTWDPGVRQRDWGRAPVRPRGRDDPGVRRVPRALPNRRGEVLPIHTRVMRWAAWGHAVGFPRPQPDGAHAPGGESRGVDAHTPGTPPGTGGPDALP